MPRNTRGVAVYRPYDQPADISFESGRLRSLSVAQDALIDYVVKTIGPEICCCMLGLSLIFPIAMITMGYIYFFECSAANYIPIYLIVAGTGFIVYVVGRYYAATNSKGYYTLLSIFLICWFITGSVWIFSLNEPNYDGNAGQYCNQYLYKFAFWITIAEYLMSFLTILYLCSLCYLSEPVE